MAGGLLNGNQKRSLGESWLTGFRGKGIRHVPDCLGQKAGFGHSGNWQWGKWGIRLSWGAALRYVGCLGPMEGLHLSLPQTPHFS